jgi:hypothetical protein
VFRFDAFHPVFVIRLQNAGTGILSTYYQYLLSQALKAVYPEHEWHEWLFSSVPTKFFEDSANQLRYMKWMEGLLDIKSLDQWYSVDPKTLQKHGGSFLYFVFPM